MTKTNEKPTSKNMVTRTIYVDEDLWGEALAKGLNISGLFREKLHEAVHATTCPSCGQKIKVKKPKKSAP